MDSIPVKGVSNRARVSSIIEVDPVSWHLRNFGEGNKKVGVGSKAGKV